MSLLVPQSFRLLRRVSESCKISQWFKYRDVTTTVRPFHHSRILFGEGIPLRMPSLSPTMMEGKIVKWLKQEGDPIQPGDVICDIETDKAVVSFEVDEEGILAKILVDQTADTLKVGTIIAVLAPEGEDWKNIGIPSDEGQPYAPSAAFSPSSATSSDVAASDNRKYGPSVRLLLSHYGVNAVELPGSGPHGELLKGDVLQYVRQRGVQPVPIPAAAPPITPVEVAPPPPSTPSYASVLPTSGSVPHTDVEVTSMRRTIAKRLLQSKTTIAHSYATLDCRVDELLALRKRYHKEHRVAVSVNDILVKGVAVALQACPAMNCVWEGGVVVQSPNIDISVAVATPSGLITPIVRGAASLGVKEISDRVRELAGRAKEGKLKLDEFQGGTFTVSNLGMFGINEFSAILNPPQCGILAVSGSRVVLGAGEVIETRMRCTLSYDRLAVDDDVATQFMATLGRLIEDPAKQILLGAAAVVMPSYGEEDELQRKPSIAGVA